MQKDARRVRCTLPNGWRLLKKYRGTLDIFFFEVEHRIRKEEMEKSSSTRKPRKDGDVQLTRRESQIKMRALKTASTRRVDFLSRSTATWKQLSIPDNEGRIAQVWIICARRYAGFFRKLLALRRLDPGGTKLCLNQW